MGYVRKRRSYRLIFADEELAGLEVVAKAATVSAYRRIAELATHEFGDRPTADELVEMDNLYREFASVLVSWNLEEPASDEPDAELVPVPATLDGLLAQDLPFVQAIVLAWMDAVGGVAAPVQVPAGFSEEDLPMDIFEP